VTLTTIHAAKDLEFSVVFICGVEDGLLPLQHRDGTRPNSDEERRLFYVALTRARVILSYARHRKVNGVMQPTLPSPYLVDLPTTLFVVGRSSSQPDRALRNFELLVSCRLISATGH